MADKWYGNSLDKIGKLHGPMSNETGAELKDLYSRAHSFSEHAERTSRRNGLLQDRRGLEDSGGVWHEHEAGLRVVKGFEDSITYQIPSIEQHPKKSSNFKICAL